MVYLFILIDLLFYFFLDITKMLKDIIIQIIKTNKKDYRDMINDNNIPLIIAAAKIQNVDILKFLFKNLRNAQIR